MPQLLSRKSSRINRIWTLAGLLAMVVSVPAFAQSKPFPTYSPGENLSGTQGPNYPSTLPNPWVVSDGAIITPAGTSVYLSTTTRAKAVAVNPTGNHTAAVLQLGAHQAVTIFNTQTGAVLQNYKTLGTDAQGSSTGITYTPDGKWLLFSQDDSFVGMASVDLSTGLLSDHAHISVPMDVNSAGVLTTVTCFPNSPGGTTGSVLIPCGQTVSLNSDGTSTSYPMGIAVTSDGKTAYVVLDNNDTLTKIDLTASSPAEGAEVRVGNVPHSVVLSADGKTAYVSNSGGRIAKESDFQGYSNGTPVVAAWPTGSPASGTVSVVDLATFKVKDSISTGLYPSGMAWHGKDLLVTNTLSDTISVINTRDNQVERTIDLGLPISIPGERGSAYGAGPNSIAVDDKKDIAYVALYNANAVAVVDLRDNGWDPVRGMIPVGYAPSSVVLDTVDDVLIVANDKGIGTTGFQNTPPENSTTTSHGSPAALNTHQDLGIVSIVPIPSHATLDAMTHQVFENNHWDLRENIWSAGGGNRHEREAAIPRRIGDPSKIKHVFVIIRENRTYDQILGDVVGGNGEPSLAVFGDGSAAQSEFSYEVTPNAHHLVQRFPLLDNFYDPSRQSADGHNWIMQAMAPYSDDIQSPDWLRDYPSNGGDALAYQKKGHLWDTAAAAGIKVKNFGEYIEYNTFNPPQGCTPPPGANSGACEPLWIDFYNDVQAYESGMENQLYNINTVASHTPIPSLNKITIQNYPQFDLGIPDQFRFDIWNQDFQRDVAYGNVPQLEFMWISSDHTGGPPKVQAMEADNDLALGRFVDAISHSAIWKDSVIFVEEDDAQDGVDHVDGHRSPGYVFSPYVKQKVNSDGTGAGVTEEATFYTQVNMTRTIEQILGLTPMNQNDLVASPMRTLFVDDPPKRNFLPWTHVPNDVPLTLGVTQTPTQTAIPGAQAVVAPKYDPGMSPAARLLMAGWMKKKAEIFAGKYQMPDSEDADTVRHYNWYEATGFKVPFPGEKKVRPASDFNRKASAASADADGDE
jgi:YVTN family beta-propeller protein